MMTWMRGDVAATTQQWVIAFWHHPPYTKGSHNSDTEINLVEMRQNALPALEAAGVDLVLCGHSHSYERSKFIRGHYGLSSTFGATHVVDGGDGRVDGDGAYDRAAQTGTVYVVAGSSGQISGGSLNHPAMYVAMNELGSLVIDVNGNRLDGFFVGDTPVARDHFTLVKGPHDYRLSTSAQGPGRVAPSGGLFAPGTQLSVTAYPAAYYRLGSWSGDAAGDGNPAAVTMTTDRNLTARFDALLVTNGVPQWWLAQQGLPTNDTAALDDPDEDGMATWGEYIAGTVPLNPTSVLAVASVEGAAAGPVVRWHSVAGQRYAVLRGTDAAQAFTAVKTNIAATPPLNVVTDATAGAAGFYRVSTRR